MILKAKMIPEKMQKLKLLPAKKLSGNCYSFDFTVITP
jgi:hypothetical protein